MGRDPKFSEPTTEVSFKAPVSKKEDFKTQVYLLLEKYKDPEFDFEDLCFRFYRNAYNTALEQGNIEEGVYESFKFEFEELFKK